jgi:hypothetical protein
MCGYAAAFVHSFCVLYCVERHVDMSPTSLMATLVSSQTPFPVIHQHFSNPVHSTHAYLPMKMGQSVPKRRHINFARLFSSQIPSPVTHQHPSNPVHSTNAYLPLKMEQTECSETSAYKHQTPRNYPKGSIKLVFT